ncbi:two-component sensor histidine kinase [Paenibacillus sp. 598K]|uniref:sensor histidine kinase n=1 Tax=Paenibacillus sp. 598K TaxID=1117987 RepID=UPI000FF962FB|nr:histidine kinase [Paenibacillus sp. 598K]GBF74081.1 two-component sensor histidine kinase [Paenibacillus sp. 598K]
MSYQQIKWLILWIPTLTIGIWEYLRHTVLLPYLSMELGNLLSPFIVFAVTVTLLRKLFRKLETTQETLRREQSLKAALEEREQLARELHDGISQSLFLLSVKLDRLEQTDSKSEAQEQTRQIRSTVRHVYEDVRQSLAALKEAPVVTDLSWTQSVRTLAADIESVSCVRVMLDWRLSDALLSAREKVELLSIVREALLNVQKHAQATEAAVSCRAHEQGFSCEIRDNGIGLREERRRAAGCYGLRMMESRAEAMGWQLTIESGQGTAVRIESKGGARR